MNALFSRLFDKRGFTVAELSIAVGLSILVILSVGAISVMIQNSKKSASTWSANMSASAVIGANFTALVTQSRPSLDFIHQPILKSCASDSTPCLRMYTQDQGFVPLDSSTASKISGDKFEFFRDHLGDLKDGLPITKRDPNSAKATLTYTMPASFFKLGSTHEVYATWPFVDETSPALSMLVWKGGAKYSVPGYTARSDALPTNFTFLKSDSGTIEATAMVGQPIVLFNAKDVRQYVVQVVTEAHSCADGAWVSTCASAAGDPTNVTSRDLVVKIAAMNASELSTMIGTGAPTGGSFPSMSAVTDRFPTISTSIVDGEATYFTGVGFDARRLLHFFHSGGISGDVVALPVGLVSFKFVPSSIAGKFDLVRDAYRAGQEPQRSVLVSETAGHAMFARRLGTQDFKLVTFDAEAGGFARPLATLKGSMADRTYTATTLDRRTITYPQDCEMTYTLNSFCGDADVKAYYAEHPEEEYGRDNANYTMVLGYWIEPKDGAGARNIPTADNWYTIGYERLELDTSHVGVQVVNSNRSVSSMQLIKSEMERVVSLAKSLDDGESYRVYVSPMLCNDTWINTTPASETGSATLRNSGILPEGAADKFGGQTCDESAMLANKVLPPAAFSDDPLAPPPAGAAPSGCDTSCEYAYTEFGSFCIPITTCTTTAPTSSPTPTPTATPTPTPTPAPDAPSPDCTGSVYAVNSRNGGEPVLAEDCWSNTTYQAGTFEYFGDPMFGYGGAYQTPGACLCNNYTAPTPTPTPTPPPTMSCTDAMSLYSPQCGGTVSCSVSSGHAYVTEMCPDNYNSWYAVDGGAPIYNPPYIGF